MYALEELDAEPQAAHAAERVANEGVVARLDVVRRVEEEAPAREHPEDELLDDLVREDAYERHIMGEIKNSKPMGEWERYENQSYIYREDGSWE